MIRPIVIHAATLAVTLLASAALIPQAQASVQLSTSTASRASAVSVSVPILQPPADMKVDPGQTADQVLHATDADSDPLTFSKLSGPDYMTVTTTESGAGTATGNIHLAPPPDTPFGSVLSVVAVTDGTSRGQSTVHVLISTNPPTLEQPADMTVAEAEVAEQTLNGSDPDLNSLAFSVVSGPSFVTVTTINYEQGLIRLAPGLADEGVYPVVVAAGDGTATDSKTLTVTVEHTNEAPQIEQPGDMTVNSGETADQTLHATDPDGQPLTFFKYGGPAFVTLTTTDPGSGFATGNLHAVPTIFDTSTPEAGPRQYEVIVEVADGALADFKTVSVTVNYPADNPPVLDQPADMTVTQGSSGSMILTGSDPDGGLLGFGLVEGPDFVWVEYGLAGWYVRARPSFSDLGTYLVVVRIVDHRGLTEEKSFHLNVVDGDEPPHIESPANMLVFAGQVAVQEFHASDPEGNPVTFSKMQGPVFMTVETVSTGPVGATGRIRLAPGPGDVGKTSGYVSVSDGGTTQIAGFSIDVRPAGVPVLTPLFDMCIGRGDSRSLILRAIDPEGDRLVYHQIGLPSYASMVDSGDGNASLVIAPGANDPSGGSFVTISVSDGTHEVSDLFTVTVGSDWECGRRTPGPLSTGDANGHPLARAGGPYSGMAGVPIRFDGTQSSDPEGNSLQFAWDLGDGSVAMGPTPVHTYARGSQYPVVLIVSDGYITGRQGTTATIADAFAARAFTPEGQARVRLFSGKPTLCASLEPVNGSFHPADVDPATLALISSGTGSVDRIAAIPKGSTLEDTDGNGIEEVRACFAKADLQRLFDQTSGPVTVQIEGNVSTGGIIRGQLALTIISTHGLASASVSPNPLNPSGTLRFRTEAPGQVSVRLFDLSGRLVRTLLAPRKLEAGDHEVAIDGRDARGVTLATGVYFYRIEMAGSSSQGRFVVAK
ncbi:MAG TPA: PKD domain-containing protein [Candidatus Eisenbacteria bacterium]|nr:PKD domain-containing protein [Candidatus Eisenbacteria bacterium]